MPPTPSPPTLSRPRGATTSERRVTTASAAPRAANDRVAGAETELALVLGVDGVPQALSEDLRRRYEEAEARLAADDPAGARATLDELLAAVPAHDPARYDRARALGRSELLLLDGPVVLGSGHGARADEEGETTVLTSADERSAAVLSNLRHCTWRHIVESITST